MFSKKSTSAMNRNVLVNLCSGNAIGGVVTYEGPTSLVVRGATVYTPESEPKAADGEVLIPHINVDFIQLL